MSNTNITEFSSGLNLDSSPVNQPKGSYRFALNTVNESELGDKSTRGIEEANEECSSLTAGYIPIGKCYIGNNHTVILSVSADNKISEIGIMDDNCNYVVHVNDKDSPEKDKLNFKVERQIQVTYRLRRGCERTIYFAGKGYPTRYFNFDKPNQFKKSNLWSASKFRLAKRIELFPTIDKIEVLDNEGNLTPGSYTVLVQHLDEDLNGTEFYELVKNINIYNDPSNKTYSDIQGSSNIGDDKSPYKYSKTSKAIKIVLDAVDKNFTYVRFAFAERISGNGEITSVKYSDPISIYSPIFTYTGDNASTEGTPEEIELFNINSGLDSAEHIEQIDNMLILANVKGEQADICKLQKYASRIKTDCFVKDIVLTSIKEKHNAKNPLVDYNGIGYQPGDINSLGIVYVFEDYSLSPVCHIPGKSPIVDKKMIYSPGENVYPMSNDSNQNLSETYIDENTSCPNSDYWGLDSEGKPLKNTNVRHHRFPTRDEIGIGFVKRKDTTGNIAVFKRIQLAITEIPKKSSNLYVAENYILKVKYKRNGIWEMFSDTIYPDSNVPLGTFESNIFQNSDSITDIKLIYTKLGTTLETEIPLVNNESAIQTNGAKYKITILEIKENNTRHIYEVPIFGLKFSDIVLPPEDEIGKKVIGYQIVRQERTDNDKNILDSAVVFPMMKSGRNVSTAMLAPDFWTGRFGPETTCEGSEDNTYPTCYNVSKRNVMLLTPGHKFMDKTYDSFTTIEQVGNYEKEYSARSATLIQNIYEGSSATGDEDKETKDDDGFSLKHGYRFTGVKYAKTQGIPLKITNENARMYNLQAVNYAESEDNKETLYNIACDNKALVLSSNKEGVDFRTYRPGKNHFPYVYIKRNNTTFYQNYRSKPYYFASTEVFTESTCKVFGGDTHVVPMRHSNHIFGNAVAALRRKRLSAWAIIGSALIAVAGIVLAFFTAGTSLAIAGGILIALGSVITLAAALVEVQKFNEIYGDKWEANLDRTVFDYFYARLFIREDPHEMVDEKDWEISKFYLSWQDDTFRWFGDAIGDLWFESQLNISLRVPPTNMENNYLLPLKEYMDDRADKWSALTNVEWVTVNGILNGSGFHRYTDNTINVEMPYEWYFTKKITKSNSGKPSGLEYLGISVPQIYLINPDHHVNIGIKKLYAIPLEYDCCSECRESFPHRIHYSNQSFQEEKSDNYRIFLPNNYRDIEGETGEITNIFRWYNNLYAHTEEGLWQMGRNYQERVTDNIVSFIGTGSYFEIPPQKVLDDDTGSSAGTRHKWGMIKTPEGIFFPSENQKRIYQFTGKELKPISELGISNWTKNNIELNIDRQFLMEKGYEYPNRDNPSSLIGSGFVSAYDSRKERIIFTKKDLRLKDTLFEGDKDFCINGNTITIFNNITNTINNTVAQGWKYSGIENCRLKFFKDVVKTRTEIRELKLTVANNADIIIHLDMSGSFNNDSRNQIKSAINQWLANFANTNPDWTGNVYYSIQSEYESQRCWKILRFIKTPNAIRRADGTLVSSSSISKNIIAVSFVNENQIGGFPPFSAYHPLMSNPMGGPASDFYNDYNDFVSLYAAHIADGGTFNGLNYPIVYSNSGTTSFWTRAFLQHVLAAMKGTSYSQAEVDALSANPFMTPGDWNILKQSLQGPNPYPDSGFENYGWKVITNRGWSGSGDVITAVQFQSDMNQFLQGINTVVQEQVQVNYIEREYLYIDGDKQNVETVIDSNASWTLSYSLEDKKWLSWHSYLPAFYITVPEKFYSWKHGNNNIWKHGKMGQYCKFYGTQYPWIIEYISSSNPTVTKIHNYITVILDAKKYQKDINEFYDVNNVFFNKMIVYNSRQCSGLMNLVLKDQQSNYLYQQVNNLKSDEVLVDRNERNWNINDFRDMRVDYNVPIFKSDLKSLQQNYFIDKVLNTDSINYNKSWNQLENFRDKYLAVRLIFDKFADTKMLLNFSLENEVVSNR